MVTYFWSPVPRLTCLLTVLLFATVPASVASAAPLGFGAPVQVDGELAAVQVVAVIGGHVLGVVLAHDRAVRVAGLNRTARTAQYPLLALLVGLTLLALRLLLG